MTEKSARERWLEFYEDVDRAAMGSKEFRAPLPELSEAYRSLSDRDRPIVDKVICEMVESDNERVRAHAVALVDELSIAEAIPALERLATQLDHSTVPSAPYDRAWARRIIARFTAGKA